jgi:hypothetical protein
MALPQAASAISPRPFAVAENFRGDLVMVNNGVAWQDVTCLRGCTPFAVATTERARFVLKRPHGRPTPARDSQATRLHPRAIHPRPVCNPHRHNRNCGRRDRP